jgi:hypothetical protein
MKKLILFFFAAITIFANYSCKKDITGCQDPTALNYNPDANVAGDCQFKGCTDKEAENYDPKANVPSDCIFSRDKFLGDFDGTLACPGDLTLLNGMTSLSIKKNLSGKNDVDIILNTTSGVVIPVKGVCKNDDLSLDTELKQVTITVAGTAITADISVKGSVKIDKDRKIVKGPMTIGVTTLLTGTLTDVCELTGVRK